MMHRCFICYVFVLVYDGLWNSPKQRDCTDPLCQAFDCSADGIGAAKIKHRFEFNSENRKNANRSITKIKGKKRQLYSVYLA